MRSVSVVIPNYNGAGLLEKYLPPLKKALSDHVATFEIIVVDDASHDTSVEFLRQQHPDVTVITNEANLGFGGTMNRGIHAARGEIIFSLNSDVLVDSDIFGAVLPRFSDPGLFAVTPNIIDPRSGYNQAVYRLKPGVCWYTDTCLQTVPAEQEVPLFFACAGACFYDRAKLLELGGFDPLFSPFYVEDVDLSYQAWKRGWRCVLEPSAHRVSFQQLHHRAVSPEAQDQVPDGTQQDLFHVAQHYRLFPGMALLALFSAVTAVGYRLLQKIQVRGDVHGTAPLFRDHGKTGRSPETCTGVRQRHYQTGFLQAVKRYTHGETGNGQ